MSNQAIDQAMTKFSNDQGNLIPLLQLYQRETGYISQEAVEEIARYLKVSENHVYGVASFYSQFNFRK